MARILIIKDDVQSKNMISQMLENTGYEVLDAANGDEGTKIFELFRSVTTVNEGSTKNLSTRISILINTENPSKKDF